jgi:hypothetical protein
MSFRAEVTPTELLPANQLLELSRGHSYGVTASESNFSSCYRQVTPNGGFVTAVRAAGSWLCQPSIATHT